LFVCTSVVRFDISHPELGSAEDAETILLTFLPFFHSYGLIATVILSLAAGYLVVTLPRFGIKDVLGCIEKYKACRLSRCSSGESGLVSKIK